MQHGRNSKGYSKNDQLYTPPEIFELIGIEFDLDVCAPPGGVPWVPAKRYLTEADDGLTTPWEGLVWMNPPYSAPKPWIKKWIAHNNGFCLVPFARSLWFYELWDSSALCTIISNRETFVTPDGDRYGIFMPTALWGIGDRAREIMLTFDHGSVR